MENTPPHHLRTILLVDDNDDTLVLTKWFFETLGYIVDTARSAKEALARFDARTHDVLLTDNSMPRMSGAELAHIIKMRSHSTFVVMFTARPPQDLSCIDVLIQKPASLIELKEAIDKLLEK